MTCSVYMVNVYIRILCVIGLILSYYSYVVELNTEEDDNYVAMCDISEHMSCTKAFSSKYGRGFGIIGKLLGEDSFFNVPNSSYGMIFYSICLYLSCTNKLILTQILFLICLSTNFVSIYLAYILYFILYDFCIVCVSTYIVNACLTIFTYNKLISVKRGFINVTKRKRAKLS